MEKNVFFLIDHTRHFDRVVWNISLKCIQGFLSVLLAGVSDKLINGTVAAQLAAALLAVSCVTVTFCVNLTMIQDKANGARKDFNVSPTGKPVIYLGYLYCLAVCFRASCVIR